MIPKLTLGALAVVLLVQRVRTSLDATRVRERAEREAREARVRIFGRADFPKPP